MLTLYQETLIDHHKNPRNYGILENASFYTEQRNNACGDEVFCSAITHEGIITAINFKGSGCVISQATASLLSEKVVTMTFKQVLNLNSDDLTAMIGITLGPVRMHCALLSLIALKNGIKKIS